MLDNDQNADSELTCAVLEVIRDELQSGSMVTAVEGVTSTRFLNFIGIAPTSDCPNISGNSIVVEEEADEELDANAVDDKGMDDKDDVDDTPSVLPDSITQSGTTEVTGADEGGSSFPQSGMYGIIIGATTVLGVAAIFIFGGKKRQRNSNNNNNHNQYSNKEEHSTDDQDEKIDNIEQAPPPQQCLNETSNAVFTDAQSVDENSMYTHGMLSTRSPQSNVMSTRMSYTSDEEGEDGNIEDDGLGHI